MRTRLTKQIWVKASAPIKPMVKPVVKPEPKLTREQMIQELTENFTDVQRATFVRNIIPLEKRIINPYLASL
jgi:hypothetical protein